MQGYFLFGGMVMTFNLLGLAAGEGGMAEIMSVGMFLSNNHHVPLGP